MSATQCPRCIPEEDWICRSCRLDEAYADELAHREWLSRNQVADVEPGEDDLLRDVDARLTASLERWGTDPRTAKQRQDETDKRGR